MNTMKPLDEIKQERVDELVALLAEANLSKSWAARQLKISYVFFVRITNGERSPSNQLADRIGGLIERLRLINNVAV